MSKFNVFLSCAMSGELDAERSAIRVLFDNDPALKEFFVLYAIEEHASPQSIQNAYTDEVRRSDLLLLLLDKQLREPVRQEFHAARDAGIKILVYIRDRTDPRDENLTQFISEYAHTLHCGSFGRSVDLCRKIRDDITSDLMHSYSEAIDDARRRTEYVTFSRIDERPWSGSRLFDQDVISKVSGSEILKDMDTDQLIALAVAKCEESGNLKEALLLYEIVLFRDGKNWQAYNNRGLILEDMGYGEDALFSYRRALELKPDSHATL